MDWMVLTGALVQSPHQVPKKASGKSIQDSHFWFPHPVVFLYQMAANQRARRGQVIRSMSLFTFPPDHPMRWLVVATC
jgi:hypothetical protein